MADHYINVPTYLGTMGSLIGVAFDLSNIAEAGTIAAVRIGFASNGGPTGGTTTLRVGTALDSPGNFVDVVVPDGFLTVNQLTAVPVSAGNVIRYRLEEDSGNAGRLFAVITIRQSGAAQTGVLYATLEDVKIAIGLLEADLTFDTEITNAIDGVSRLFDSLVPQPFFTQTQVEFHDGWALRNGIALNKMPNEQQVTRDAAVVEESGTTLTNGTEWMMDPFPSRMIYRLNGADEFGTRFLTGERNVKVTYETAFTSIPTAINRACRDESQRAFQAYKNDDGASARIGLSSRTPSDGTVFDFAADELTSTTLLALRPYQQGHYV